LGRYPLIVIGYWFWDFQSQNYISSLTEKALKELDRLGVNYNPKGEMKRVFGHTRQDYQN